MSLVGSQWVRANSWVICVLVFTLPVEDSNNNPTEGGADAHPSPLTSACLARKVSSDASSEVESINAQPSS